MHNFTDELSKSSKMMKSNEKEIHNLSKTIKTAMTLSRTSKVTKLTSRMKSEFRKLDKKIKKTEKRLPLASNTSSNSVSKLASKSPGLQTSFNCI